MKLIFIYGPPAVGKLTIAQAISETTGYPLLHNHLTVDLLIKILPFGSPEFHTALEKIRLDIIEAAAQASVPGLIMTFVYEKGVDDQFIQKLLQTVTNNNGEIRFIQLTASLETLKARVANESRLNHRKLNSVEKLEKALAQSDLISSIDFVQNEIIDTTNITETEVISKTMKRISFWFKLWS